MGEALGGLGTDLSGFVLVWAAFQWFGGSCLAWKLCGPKTLRVICVEAALPGNLFTDIPSWEATPVYLQQIFTRLTSTTSVPMPSYQLLSPLYLESRKDFVALFYGFNCNPFQFNFGKPENWRKADILKIKYCLRPLIQQLEMQTLLGAGFSSWYWNWAIKMQFQGCFSPLFIKKNWEGGAWGYQHNLLSCVYIYNSLYLHPSVECRPLTRLMAERESLRASSGIGNAGTKTENWLVAWTFT